MTTYDFGSGPVPAHRHINPDKSLGGWVANTTYIADNAQVYGDARVYGNARVYGDAEVSGNAQVTYTPICISGLYWPVTITDNHMRIGCEMHLKTEWNNFDDARIKLMDSRALEFWNQYKGILLFLCDKSKQR